MIKPRNQSSSSTKETKLDNQPVITEKQPEKKEHENEDAPESITLTKEPSLQSSRR